MKSIKEKLPSIDGIIVHCAHSDIVPIDKLKPYPRNNKTHPEPQIELLTKAIKTQGWRAPITVSNQTGYIVRGHARLEAAKRLGLKSVPVDYQNYASPEAERADRIADNRLAELGETDLAALKDELLELDTGAMDIELTGFDEKAMEDLMTQFAPDEEEKRELDCVSLPFGLHYKPSIVRRKGVGVVACSIYHGEQEIIDAIKKWKTTGSNDDETTKILADIIAKTATEIGLPCLCVTTPQRHHEGFHAATSIAQSVAKKLLVPFMDLFGFTKEGAGHHPIRNAKRKQVGLVKKTAGDVLIIDDVATSGETMRAAVQSVRDTGEQAAGLVMVHYWPE